MSKSRSAFLIQWMTKAKRKKRIHKSREIKKSNNCLPLDSMAGRTADPDNLPSTGRNELNNSVYATLFEFS